MYLSIVPTFEDGAPDTPVWRWFCFTLVFIEVWLIYNVVFIFAVLQNYSGIYIYIYVFVCVYIYIHIIVFFPIMTCIGY